MAQSLESRINAALRSAARLKDVEGVIADVEAEIGATQVKFDRETARSIDPALTTPQAREARNTAADLEHDIRRLNASLGLLRERRDKIVADAEEARRQAHFDAVKAERDDLARHIRARYPELALELLEMAQRIAKSDADCDKVRLKSAELVARECGWQWDASKGGGHVTRIANIHLPLLTREGGYLPVERNAMDGSTTYWEKKVESDQEYAKRPIPDLDPAPAKAA
ncbi:hypothetical protein BV97_03963 [Novosphingobium resinovorum]|uniref:Uncharacterized protein n=1 Tax=Novosphingobium resinovorum TaxID=158500 RepID=A0A031JP27_9SPHN|nr:hypothetical protein [Novosphingobium resinovorum]EZP79526.1 hypothetical protein BV97_03963 [Novosphingobium resinovorum]